MQVANYISSFLNAHQIKNIIGEPNKLNLLQDIEFPFVLIYPPKIQGKIQQDGWLNENYNLTCDILYRYEDGLDFMQDDANTILESAFLLAKLIAIKTNLTYPVLTYELSPLEHFTHNAYITGGVRLQMSLFFYKENECDYVDEYGNILTSVLSFVQGNFD